MIVADTNLVSYLIIEGTRTAEAKKVWLREPAWVLPPLWRSEFLNVLAVSVHASVLSVEQAQVAWRRATDLFRSSEIEPNGSAVLDAAIRLDISAYDAHFIVVAEELGTWLVTHDRKLLDRCPNQTVSMTRFGEGWAPG